MSVKEILEKYKIVLLGSYGVGKTALARQFAEGVFFEGYHSTIGVSIKDKFVSIDDKKMKLVIWDTEGLDEHNPSIKKSYLNGAHGYLLVIDGTRKETLGQALDLNKAVQPELHTKPFLVVVNKLDLIEKWKFSDNDLKNLKQKLLEDEGLKDQQVERTFKTSAKYNTNVQETFLALARQILENQQRYSRYSGSA